MELSQQLDCQILYTNGIAHEKAERFAQAKECYLKSAYLGYVRSEFRLGVLLLKGKGQPPNKTQAFTYFTKAANYKNRDQAKACIILGEMLETGDGVAQDLHQALHWYNTALNLGHPYLEPKIVELKQKIATYQSRQYAVRTPITDMVMTIASAPSAKKIGHGEIAVIEQK